MDKLTLACLCIVQSLMDQVDPIGVNQPYLGDFENYFSVFLQ